MHFHAEPIPEAIHAKPVSV